ncbi:MAG: hypothetical protein JRG96_07630 [Deltaproteobacteria bacterium]|nr:hypothetical protein [Deltaproteobacteria bacterium]MBW2417973.1 hypothetical protein [Deltaproteobacteria bacterium]
MSARPARRLRLILHGKAAGVESIVAGIGVPMSPEALLDDGLLDVAILPGG